MDFFNFLDDFWDVVGDDVLDRLKDVLEYAIKNDFKIELYGYRKKHYQAHLVSSYEIVLLY